LMISNLFLVILFSFFLIKKNGELKKLAPRGQK